MGACNSSAALDPTDVACDGTAPVYWSPERDAEKRAAKLRETRQKQQAEIERATGHLKKHASGSRSTVSKSQEEQKQQAEDSSAVKPTAAVQNVRPSRTSRPASASFTSPAHAPVVSDEELSNYPLPKSARRHARAVSASASSMASPMSRSPEVSERRSEGEALASPQAASRRASMAPPEPVQEEEGRATEEEKEGDASAPEQPTTSNIAFSTSSAPATPSAIKLRAVSPVKSVQRDEKAHGGDGSVGAAFGVQLRRVPTAASGDAAAAVTVTSAVTA